MAKTNPAAQHGSSSPLAALERTGPISIPAQKIRLQELIESVWQSRGFTAVLVTHDVAEAIVLADRVVLIEGGRVALDEFVHLPRPRARGSSRFAALEDRILERVLQRRSAEISERNIRAVDEEIDAH